MFDASIVFLENLNAEEKVIVNQGGTSSGKTYSILQVFVSRAIYMTRKVFTVVGQDIPNLKKGSYRDFEAIIANSEYAASQIINWNKTDRIITFKSGSIIARRMLST